MESNVNNSQISEEMLLYDDAKSVASRHLSMIDLTDNVLEKITSVENLHLQASQMDQVRRETILADYQD